MFSRKKRELMKTPSISKKCRAGSPVPQASLELPRRDGQEMSASSLVDLSACAPTATLKRPTSLSRHASAAGFPLSPVVPRGIGKAPKPLVTHSPGESYEETVLEAEDIAHLLADVAHFAEGLEQLRDVMLQEGIQTSQDARFYALSARFEPFSNQEKTLVVQFTVKHEQNIDCGGGYVKLFPSTLNQEDMHGDSEYNIMFGPDICGPGTKKVHVIFNYKGKNVLINKDIRCKDDEFTHLYTLIVRPDNTYEVKIDNSKVESGNLEDDWDFLPPKKIKDPEAKKPDDWDERAKIDDPEDTKPEDWDKPEHIPDPDAKKPEDWDEEMDGEWEPPVIQNPEYKGEWKPRQIDNPNYKGKWIHPEIENPEYTSDSNLYKYDDFGVLGFDLWQVKSGTIFDNILITDDEKYAEEVGKETWGATKDAEKKMKEQQDEEQRKKQEEEDKKKKEEEGEDEADGEDNEEEEDDDEEDEEKEEEEDTESPLKDEL